MNSIQRNTARLSPQAWKPFLLLALLVCIAAPVLAQNTKGDKPANQAPLIRFPKIKSKHKGGDRANTRDISGRRRIRTKNKSSANRTIYRAPNPYASRKKSSTDRAAQPMGRIFNSSPGGGQRAWLGTASGSPIRVRSSSAKRARNNVYPQNGRYVNHASQSQKTKVYTRTSSGKRVVKRVPDNRQRPWKGNLRGGSIGSATASRPFVTRGRKNVYWGKFSKGEKPVTHDLTGRQLLKRNFHSPGIGVGTSDTLKIAKRKAKGKTFSGKVRGGYVSASRRGERAWTGDVSGQPIRKRGAKGGEPSSVYIFGLNRSPSERARTNNPLPARRPGIGAGSIARVLRKITGRRTAKGGGSTNRSRNNNGRPVDVRTPGLGASGIGKFQGNFHQGDLFSGFSHAGAGFAGNFKSRRALKGGGSLSGKYLNNKGRPIDVRTPGIGAQGIGRYQGNFHRGDLFYGFNHEGAGFAGNIKARRLPKGGGSLSGKYLNNKGQPIDVRAPGVGSQGIGKYQGNFHRGDLFYGFNHEGAGFAGNIKGRRQLKGGGSVSGKYLNNKGLPIDVRAPGVGSQGIGRFQGNIRQGDFFGFSHAGAGFSGSTRARRPPKGGGSVSGKVWNNGNAPLQFRGGAPGFDQPSRFRGNIATYDAIRDFGNQGYHYSGNIKTRRPKKGGGSVSEIVFNNHEHPIEVHAPGSATARASGFSGALKAKRPEKGGGSISGKVWNNNEKPIDVRNPSIAQINDARYTGSVRLSLIRRNYIQNPKASDKSIKKRRPNGRIYLVEGLGVKSEQGKYRKKPHATANALPGIGPSAGTVKASEYSHAMKMYWSYKHNPSSNGNALKVIAPGKAYARINDYQGNMKMRKYTDKRMHPDAPFAHGSRDNVKADRTLMMNLKLIWAKLFKKNDTQPAVVKEKEHRPRYDKKEKDLWKALYD